MNCEPGQRLSAYGANRTPFPAWRGSLKGRMEGSAVAQKNKQTDITVHAGCLSAGDLAWVDAQWQWHRGDVRPLAELVRAHDLSAEVRAFVADILLGVASQMDGRKTQRQTDQVMESYKNIRRYNDSLARLNATELIIAEKDIWRMLDEKFGYQPGTAKRTVSRNAKRKPDTK